MYFGTQIHILTNNPFLRSQTQIGGSSNTLLTIKTRGYVRKLLIGRKVLWPPSEGFSSKEDLLNKEGSADGLT